jgi:hypothetical protein
MLLQTAKKIKLQSSIRNFEKKKVADIKKVRLENRTLEWMG